MLDHIENRPYNYLLLNPCEDHRQLVGRTLEQIKAMFEKIKIKKRRVQIKLLSETDNFYVDIYV